MLADGTDSLTTEWALSCPGETRWVEFGDDAMLFNPVSWDTHRVSMIIVLVLEALREGADTVPAILQALPPSDLPRSTLEEGVQRALEDLLALGIVRASHAG